MNQKAFGPSPSLTKRISVVIIYSIAMGYLESAVVIYLRETVFGNSFQVFPVRFLQPQLGGIEFVREAATIIMLLTIGYLAGRNKFQQFMFFVFSFAVWDLFYYLFLRIFTGWPSSLGDFDVLFLIPVMWISPVICPILISLLLTLGASLLIFSSEKNQWKHGKGDGIRINFINIIIFILGSAVDFYSFTEQIFRILFHQGPKGLENFTPTSFDWTLFIVGYILLCVSVIMTIRDSYHKMESGFGAEQNER